QANSAMFDFAKTSAPASRSLRTWNASLAGIEPFNDSDPAVVGMSAVLKLSLTIRGTQCRGRQNQSVRIWRRGIGGGQGVGVDHDNRIECRSFLVVRRDAIEIHLD